MKFISQLIRLSLLLFVFSACEKDENRIYFEGGTPPVLTSSVTTTTLPLSFANKDNEALKIRWTNPDYNFTTGVSSQNVTYQIEIDTVGANFTNPAKKTISLSNSLSHSFTQAEFNDFLLNQLNLRPGMPHNIEIRVLSTLANNAAKLSSNVLKYTVTPYAIPPKVTPPASGKLFITGSATPASWMGGGDPELASQRFTQVSPTEYVLNSIALNGGQSYLFVPVYGNWSNKYGYTGEGNKNNEAGDDFMAGGNDFKAPAVSGNYKIVVDFQRGKFTVTKL